MSISVAQEKMNTFRVWARPLGQMCRLRINGRENAEWLLGRLAEVFNNCGSITQLEGSSSCVFEVPYNNERLSRCTLEKMLAAIPEVELMLAPERSTNDEEAEPASC
jgi:hypothetical protein